MKSGGMVIVESDATYDDTVLRLNEALEMHEIVPMAWIDHAELARAAGLSLRPLLLVVFGNPSVGTPLMLTRPALGIDLPLKLLVWETEDSVWIGYNEPAWLAARHSLPEDRPELAAMRNVIQSVASQTAGEWVRR